MLDELKSPNSIEFWCKRTPGKFWCTICNHSFTRKWNLKRHIQEKGECERAWDQTDWISQCIILYGDQIWNQL